MCISKHWSIFYLFLFFIAVIKLLIIFDSSSIRILILESSSWLKNPSLCDKINPESNSLALPFAWPSCKIKVAVDLTDPSEIFNEIEVDALLSYDVIPKISSLGNLLVSLYTSTAMLMAFCQTNKSSNELILLIT